MRKIIHIDMDAFFASVEQRDFPDRYAGRPVAVGGEPPRGVVKAASYEARAAGGVRSAMSSLEAKRRCPDLLFAQPRMDVYQAVSARIRGILKQYTDLVEPASLDEAYLDVTTPKAGAPPSGTLIARRIRQAIWNDERLTASAGVGRSKFVAKVASDYNKPDGLTVVPPTEEAAFIAALPIGAFRGVGPVTEAKMRGLGVTAGAELRSRSEAYLRKHFGKRGRFFYRLAHGEDERRVKPNRESKSVGAERTYAEGLRAEDEIQQRLAQIAGRVARRLAEKRQAGHTVTLKVKTADFETHARQQRFPRALHRESDLRAAGAHLLKRFLRQSRVGRAGSALRLVGLSVSALTPQQEAKQATQLAFSFLQKEA